METTAEKLDRLAELQSAHDVFVADKDVRIKEVITPEISAKIGQIERETAERTATISAEIEELEAQIKAEVLAAGTTAKGKYIMATWNKGRAGGWDSAKLEGFALVHPEILKAKKPDGEPTVSFRSVK